MCDSKLSENFEINLQKKNMINGYDDIDYLYNMKLDIEQFESKFSIEISYFKMNKHLEIMDTTLRDGEKLQEFLFYFWKTYLHNFYYKN